MAEIEPDPTCQSMLRLARVTSRDWPLAPSMTASSSVSTAWRVPQKLAGRPCGDVAGDAPMMGSQFASCCDIAGE